MKHKSNRTTLLCIINYLLYWIDCGFCFNIKNAILISIWVNMDGVPTVLQNSMYLRVFPRVQIWSVSLLNAFKGEMYLLFQGGECEATRSRSDSSSETGTLLYIARQTWLQKEFIWMTGDFSVLASMYLFTATILTHHAFP